MFPLLFAASLSFFRFDFDRPCVDILVDASSIPGPELCRLLGRDIEGFGGSSNTLELEAVLGWTKSKGWEITEGLAVVR
jgi:hypothetical protein